MVSVGELLEEVKKDLPFFHRSGGGVTLSGGEPAMQPGFSYNFLRACIQNDIPTALETSGYAQWKVISRLASVTDLLLYDLKLLDSPLHQEFTGVSNDLILGNLEKLASQGHDIQVRVPCIPGINDGTEHIRSVADFVFRLGIKKIALLPYNAAAGAKYQWIGRSFPLAYIETQTEEYMASLSEIASEAGLEVQVGG